VWGSHELDEGWSTKYSVVLRLPVYHLKLKGFSSEVVSVSKDDVEVDSSQGWGYFSWFDAVEGGV